MLYSQTLEDRELSFFRSMLWHVLSGDANYKVLVDPVIKDVYDLITGQKNHFSIDRDYYHVITYLAEHEKDFFLSVNPISPADADYEYVYSTLKGANTLTFA